MDTRLACDGFREYALLGKMQVTIPYAVYLDVQRYLTAIGSSLKPDDLIAEIVRGFLGRLNL